jgi:hypothetical protein
MPTTGEQQVIGKDTPLRLELVIVSAGALLWLGGLSWSSKAMADDVKELQIEVVKKADKAQAEDREKRLQALERFVAVQSEANVQNKDAHQQIERKLDQVLSAVQRKP